MSLEDKIKSTIRDVPDFPKPGILFKDISPIMLDPGLSEEIVQQLARKYSENPPDAIAGIESRGFLFGYPLAMKLGVPFVLIRKEGKLPYKKVRFAYQLEYGEAVVEMHNDAVREGNRVLIHDDLLATGGSAAAAASLIKQVGGEVYGFSFLVSLDFLDGEKKLTDFSDNIYNLVRF
jgi:adenine phosphoribosyltransferase